MVITQIPPIWFESFFCWKLDPIAVLLGRIEILVFAVVLHSRHLLGNIIAAPAEKHFVQHVRTSVFPSTIDWILKAFSSRFVQTKPDTRIRHWRRSARVWLMLRAYYNVGLHVRSIRKGIGMFYVLERAVFVRQRHPQLLRQLNQRERVKRSSMTKTPFNWRYLYLRAKPMKKNVRRNDSPSSTRCQIFNFPRHLSAQHPSLIR